MDATVCLVLVLAGVIAFLSRKLARRTYQCDLQRRAWGSLFAQDYELRRHGEALLRELVDAHACYDRLAAQRGHLRRQEEDFSGLDDRCALAAADISNLAQEARTSLAREVEAV